MTMNITLKRTGLMLVLASALGSSTVVLAKSRFQDGDYGHVAQNDDRFRSNQDRRGDDGRRQPQDRYNGNNNDNRNAERSEQARRDPRMSPDERRALRRQIDEAGRDIYAPRR
jgi:hypothetical protein